MSDQNCVCDAFCDEKEAPVTEWGVRFPSGAVQSFGQDQAGARRLALTTTSLRPDLPTLVVRQVVTPWEVPRCPLTRGYCRCDKPADGHRHHHCPECASHPNGGWAFSTWVDNPQIRPQDRKHESMHGHAGDPWAEVGEDDRNGDDT